MKLSNKSIIIISLFALFLQIIIITYNHLTGFINIPNFLNLLQRILIGTTFSALFGIILIYLNLKLISLLNLWLSWHHSPILRFITESITGIVVAAFIGSAITLTAHIPFPYSDLSFHVINNSLITIVINILILSTLEAIIYFKKNKEITSKAEQLEKQNIIIQLETLKNQLNPHFLFNSLNILSALVRKDQTGAEKFISEFSRVYRYILDVSGKQVVELKEELNFTRSYFYLNQIRFENSITLDISIEAEKLNYYIPPLALQTLIENVLKHNSISSINPVNVSIFNSGNTLTVKNNLRPKLSSPANGGIGLKNLSKRYLLITGIQPSFTITDSEYIAAIPLIETE